VLSEKQKIELQSMLRSILQKKDFSESTFEETERKIHAIITAQQAEEIRKIMKEAIKLAHDVQNIFDKRREDIVCMVSLMDSDLAKGVEPAVVLAGLRSSLKDAIAKMADDVDSLQFLSRQDSLTGLANRRSFDAFLQKAVASWEAHETPISMIMLDIDHFKDVNDTFGHSIGDQVLQALAEELTKIVEPLAAGGDNVLVARYGGEEFALVLCGELASRAVLLAEVIRKTARRIVVVPLEADADDSRRKVKLTVSCGVSALWKGWQGNWQAKLIDTADKALYRAKSNGRNCTVQFLHDGEEQYKSIAPR
jgi:diguanylate cyclase (GGDEF)-like protein